MPIGRDLPALRRQFDAVNETIARAVSAASPRVVALVAKWDKSDLVPGLSDLDYRVICDAQTTADDWVQIDQAVGRMHLRMVEEHPEWNRINEHPIGAGLTLSELDDPRLYNPECATWTVWWGRQDWHDRLAARLEAEPLGAEDERYHIQRFLTYFTRYQHGIDPPINLGPFESKYALHSRCWHYFAPPMFSAACLLARRRFGGKRQALLWLQENGFAAAQVRAVLDCVDAHYESAEVRDPAAMSSFEEHLFEAFGELYPRLCASVEDIAIVGTPSPAELKAQLARDAAIPAAIVLDSVRFARIRAGRYFFYLNAPSHFDAAWLLANEFVWLKKLVLPVCLAVGAMAGSAELPLAESLRKLNIDAEPEELQVLDALLRLVTGPASAGNARTAFAPVVDMFPTYYRLLERILGAVVTEGQCLPR